MRIWLLVPLLLGCRGSDKDDLEATSTSWLHGFGVAWDQFNHRISVLEVRPSDEAMDVAFVGGASTTGIVFDPTGTCVTTGCQEFPFIDASTVTVSAQHGEGTGARFAQGSATLIAGATEVSSEVVIDLGGEVSGEGVAFIRGFRMDTARVDAPNDSCYDTRHGWLPRTLALATEVVTVGADSVTVEVSAIFEAGETAEDERVCMDAIFADAEAEVIVDVAVAVGEGSVETATINRDGSYDCPNCPLDASPPEQPTPGAVEVGLTGALQGWQRIELRMHRQDSFPRGAYLRTWDVDLDVSAGTANGHATNYSPITQQSGFDFEFEGTVVAADFADVETRVLEYRVDGLAATVDANTGDATVTTLQAR